MWDEVRERYGVTEKIMEMEASQDLLTLSVAELPNTKSANGGVAANDDKVTV